MSDQGTIATLGGYPVLGRSSASWDLVDGTRPHRQLFELYGPHAEALMADQKGFTDPQNPGKGVDLVWQIAGGPTMTAQKLFPINLAPTDIPQTLHVVVADIRYWWSYQHVARAYNVRRRVGTYRFTTDGGPLEIQPLIPSIAYAPWSLKDFASATAGQKNVGPHKYGTLLNPWTAKEVLINVLDVVTGDPARYRLDGEFKRDIPIEGLQIDDDGQAALMRVLAFLSGTSLFIDYDGTAVVRDSRDGREGLIVDALAPFPGGPLPALISHRLSRPSKIRCLFTRRLEIRLDSAPEVSTADQAAAIGTQVSNDTRDESLLVTNVAPVPDATLVMPGGNLVVTGTYQWLSDLFTAWESNRVVGQRQALDADLIRRTWLAPGFLQAWVDQGNVDASAVLARRIATARGAFRATYQMDRRLLDRVASIEASRVGILDYATGQLAPSRAYLDWTALYSMRGPIRAGEALSFRIMQTFPGYPGSSTTPLASGAIAPFSVAMLDPEQGVFHVAPIQDPTGAVISYVPGRVVGPNGGAAPVADPREGKAGGSGTILRQQGGLTTGFAVAVVLTVVPGAPNNEARFHVEEVTPAMVEGPQGISRSLGPCDGPALDIRIGPDMTTANTIWQDNPTVSGAIKGALSMAPFGDPKTLTIANQDDVKNVALAAACQAYMGDVDRVEGGITGAINPTVRPIGSVSRVSHGLAPNGVATTTVVFPPEPPTLDIKAFLNEATRRRILGLVNKKTFS